MQVGGTLKEATHEYTPHIPGIEYTLIMQTLLMNFLYVRHNLHIAQHTCPAHTDTPGMHTYAHHSCMVVCDNTCIIMYKYVLLVVLIVVFIVSNVGFSTFTLSFPYSSLYR